MNRLVDIWLYWLCIVKAVPTNRLSVGHPVGGVTPQRHRDLADATAGITSYVPDDAWAALLLAGDACIRGLRQGFIYIYMRLRWLIGASKSFKTVLFQFHFNCADCRQFTVQHTKEQQQPPNPRILIRHANRPMVSLSTHHRRQQFIHTVDTFWR